MYNKFIDLSLVRQHCRIDDDDHGQDDVLRLYADAAREWVINATGYSEEELLARWVRMPTPLVQAMLLLAGHFFAYREASVPGSLTPVGRAMHDLIAPYTKLLCV